MIIFLKNPFLNNISFHFFAKKKKKQVRMTVALGYGT